MLISYSDRNTELDILLMAYNSLTPTEKICVEWLLKGKTAPEIALILEKSSRTVEKQIACLKDKLDSVTLFQLGAKIAKIYQQVNFN
jgi:DNA-binding CsgD family transcriptional regulator